MYTLDSLNTILKVLTENEKIVDLIDVEKAFKEKSPRLYRILPRFFINYLKKLVHQNDLNHILRLHHDKTGLNFIKHSLAEMKIKTNSQGLENIPEKGGVIVVSNHPLGGIDGAAIINEVGKARQDLHILVNDLIMQIKHFKPILIPVNKHGKTSRTNLSFIDTLYASEKCIMLFPAGLVSRRQKNKIIEDLEWQKSFIAKSIKHQTNIIPVFIDGHNSKKFYNLAYWRKKLGIKANIEMLFLADEMFKQKGNTINFTFGKSISWKLFNKEHTNLEWAQKVKKHVYALKSNKHKSFCQNIDKA